MELMTGIEPATPILQVSCATYCATSAHNSFRVLIGSKRFVDKSTIPLSSRIFLNYYTILRKISNLLQQIDGTPRGIRTPTLRIRNPMHCPIMLQGLMYNALSTWAIEANHTRHFFLFYQPKKLN